jgi:hypothetical protein
MLEARLLCHPCRQTREQERQAAREAQAVRQEEMSRQYRSLSYAQYRDTPYWAEQEREFFDERTRFLGREGCDLCPERGRPLTVFHRTFDSIPFESASDLTALCPDCSRLALSAGKLIAPRAAVPIDP